MNSKIESLQIGYISTLQEYVTQLEKLLSHYKNNNLGKDQHQQLLFISHRLAGNGAIFGFANISKTGSDLQDGLNNKDEDAKSIITKISDLIDACNLAIKNKPQSSNVENNQDDEKTISSDQIPLLLVIDDDASIRNTIKELLKNIATVVTGERSEEILDLIKQHNPDLVLLDDMMEGGISGLQMLETIQSTPEISNTHIIMLTASKQTNKVMRALMAGAVDYITKPFNPEDLTKKITNYLSRINQKILIADDDIVVSELLKHKFTNVGFKVVCANDGKSAWNEIQQQNFALVLLDYMMPGFDGMSILHMMKEDPKLTKIPAIFLTAKHSGEDINHGLESGAVDYITKPFDSGEVVTRCVKILNRTKEIKN